MQIISIMLTTSNYGVAKLKLLVKYFSKKKNQFENNKTKKWTKLFLHSP